jgi:hypothetical protein
MTLEALQLSPTMLRCATDLLEAFPTVVYLSGRRDLDAQAHAMACQVVTDRRWIGKTYLHAALLQTAVDFHPECVTVEQIQELLRQTMRGMSDDELAHVSDHLAGNAVDIMPMEDADGQFTPTGHAVYTWIHNCLDTKTFLMREGGKVIWHWATRPPVEA